MNRDRWVQLIAGCVVLACLGCSAVLATLTSASAGRNRLVYAESSEASDPPEVALGVAMGAFRGLFVNMLWMRANELKEEGKYYEAVDLASTITKLQPRFGRVWSFHAWNLAYNISVATQTREERWQWVKAGIDLLRTQGVPANPSDTLLHKELAWILLHKVQGYMDDAHHYYKREFAKEWTIALGDPPRVAVVSEVGEVGEPEVDNKQLFIEKWLKPIAEAADTLDEVYAAQPKAKELVEQLRKLGYEPDWNLLERQQIVRAFYQPIWSLGMDIQTEDSPLVQLLGNAEYKDAVPALMRHIRKKMLREKYNMDVRRMIRYTEKFGPMDWRHPAAHAVYWSAKGVEEGLLRMNEGNVGDFDFVNTDRITIQAVQELYRTGTIYFDINNPDFFIAIPNADFIATYGQQLEELSVREEMDFEKTKSANIKSRTYRLYSAGYENFLRDAIRYLYRRGDKEKAGEYYHTLRTFNKANTHLSVYRIEELSVPLDDFVTNEIVRVRGGRIDEDRLTSPEVARSEITGALQAAYLNGLWANNDKVFRSEMEYAILFYQTYSEQQKFYTSVNHGDSARLEMPPLRLWAANLLAGLIRQMGVTQGALLYRRAPEDLRGRAYVLMAASPLKAQLDAGAEQEGGPPPFDAWFPPPDDVEEYVRLVQEEMPKEQESPTQAEMR